MSADGGGGVAGVFLLAFAGDLVAVLCGVAIELAKKFLVPVFSILFLGLLDCFGDDDIFARLHLFEIVPALAKQLFPDDVSQMVAPLPHYASLLRLFSCLGLHCLLLGAVLWSGVVFGVFGSLDDGSIFLVVGGFLAEEVVGQLSGEIFGGRSGDVGQTAEGTARLQRQIVLRFVIIYH